jgi:hypothetical protein
MCSYGGYHGTFSVTLPKTKYLWRQIMKTLMKTKNSNSFEPLICLVIHGGPNGCHLNNLTPWESLTIIKKIIMVLNIGKKRSAWTLILYLWNGFYSIKSKKYDKLDQQGKAAFNERKDDIYYVITCRLCYSCYFICWLFQKSSTY